MRARFLALAVLPLLTIALAPGQEKTTPPPEAAAAKDVLPFGPSLLLPADTGLPRKVQAVRDLAAAKQWDEAARLLEDLLDRPEDVFIPLTRRGADGKDVTTVVSLRGEMERLLAGLPRPGLEAYERVVGRQAALALTDAKGDPAALAAVVGRFPHTKAGTEAATLLGTHYLDRGHFDLAAAYFERVLRSPDTAPPLTLFRAALAFRRAGARERADDTWRRLAAAAPDGISLGERTIPLDDLEKTLNRPVAARAEVPAEALLPEASWHSEPRAPNPAHLSAAIAGARAVAPAGAPVGSFLPIVVAAKVVEPNALALPHTPSPGAVWLAEAARRLESASQPILPAATPLVVGDKVVWRGLAGVRAVDLRSGRIAWEAPSPLALDNLLARDPADHRHVGQWVESYLASHPAVLLDNSVLGSLSSDGRRVYAVEDLPVPPRPDNYAGFFNNQGQGLHLPDDDALTQAVYHSKLLALDAASGKVAWELGGRHSPAPVRDCFFLGPPLPLGGKLYVPVEQGFDLRLLCLEPQNGSVVWAQTLATFKSRLVIDGGRRLHAVGLAYGDGLLVCPTQAGGVVAFDLVGRSLAWAHIYREEPPAPDPPPFIGRRRPRGRFVTEPPNLTSEWKVSAPVIASRKVVLTAPDAPLIRCLHLHDGTSVWEARREEGDLFVTGAGDDRVLVVGKGQVRALSLADGKPLWQCDTPAPAGHGAGTGALYSLPVRGASGKAEVLTLDVVKGAVVSQTALPERLIAAAPAVEGGGPVAFADLINQLGSEAYAARERATQALDAAGPAALDALRKVAAGAEPEARRRAEVLVRAIEKRRETAQLIEPQKLRLQYKDTPLAEAVADFSKRAGVTLKLHPDRVKADDRKITLDTGLVTFWEALDQFCAKAGLEEMPLRVTAHSPYVSSGSGIVITGGRGSTRTDILRGARPEKPPEVTLIDGKFVPRPTSDVGTLRVRVAPPETHVWQERKEDDEVLFALDVMSAGRAQWVKAVGLRLDRALDENGRAVSQLPTSFKPPPSATAGRGSVMINGMPIVPPPDEPEGPAARVVPVRLRRAAGAAPKKLRELSGTIVAQMRTAHEPVVTVENVLKAAGKTVAGPRGGEVKVLDVAKDEDGQIRLKVRVERVGRGAADVPVNPFGGGTVIVNGRRLGEEDLLSSTDFSLLDDKGRPFRTARAVSTGTRAGAAHEYELVYEPESSQGEAAKFVYADRRTLFIEVPFTLRDVPLP
jgi:outer membrane protein assembly factor BamB